MPLAGQAWAVRHPLSAGGLAAKAGRGVPCREPAQAADRRIRSPNYLQNKIVFILTVLTIT